MLRRPKQSTVEVVATKEEEDNHWRATVKSQACVSLDYREKETKKTAAK